MKFHSLLHKKYNNWRELEEKIEDLPTTKEMGDVFEQFVFIYLNLNKTLYQISEVYMEKDISYKYRKEFDFEKRDCGVDGLFILKNGKSAAYQVKFRTSRSTPSIDELSKFWAEARRTDYHYTITNAYYLSKLCRKNKKHVNILVDDFDRLDKTFFEEIYNFVRERKIVKTIFEPYDFQKEIIDSILTKFKGYDRGKLIAACGTGKTLMALWVTQSIDAKKILFVAPSLALIKQTLESWAEQSKDDFSYLCVCSDISVSDEVDSGDLSIIDLNVPVTTSVDVVSRFLSINDYDGKQIIFSTYQSLDVLAKALNSQPNFYFDIVVFDEAHRTAGTKNSGLFSLALHDQYIKAKKRLYMTATERLVRPWIIKKAKEYDRIVFSMDDENLYGPIFSRFNFGRAIQEEIISDYRIIVAGIKQKEIYEWIKNNTILVNITENSEEYYSYAQNIFSQIMLVKAMSEFPIRKIISFHSSIKNAKTFIGGFSDQDITFKYVLEKVNSTIDSQDLFMDHVNGSMSAGERKRILDEFQESKYGLISNARCLTEGVDVPIIDSVYFVNPKHSLIDIIQACGRALRKPKNKQDKMAYFIVPILIPEEDVGEEIINKIDFDMLHNLIQSLRDQDERLAEWIDRLNLQASKGKTYKFTEGTDSPVILEIPKELNIQEFERNLYLKIAEVNSEPTSYRPKTKKYGIKERKSDYNRIFKTLGDYSVESYKQNLVLPTINKFNFKDEKLSMKSIKINHNNVSHTQRLGLITKDYKTLNLTPLGKLLFNKKLDFENIFKRQMLRYFNIIREKGSERILFPYRACFKILKEIKTLNYVEFVFGLYTIIDSSEESIHEAINDILYIRKNYPNIEILNEANKPDVLNELNEYFGTVFTSTDIWEKKTTINNQYIYFRNHLTLFNEIIKIDKRKQTISIIENSESKIDELLEKDVLFEKEDDKRKLQKLYVESFIIFKLFNLK